MTDGSDSMFAQLSKKIDDQARFTRGVNIICTLAILGVMFYTLTSIVATLPDLVLATFMGNMEKVAAEWKFWGGGRAPHKMPPPAQPPISK
jgi:hypothetical protein